ncbi:MAG: outer-membrane lipoprotein carrier protein LolA [Mariprofundales bacterium]
MKKIFSLVFFTSISLSVLMFFSQSLSATTTITAKEQALLAKTIEHYAELDGFACSFTQLLLFSDQSRKLYHGTLEVRRPAKFRWQYIRPYEQWYVSDGKKIWHYEPDLLQVRILPDLEQVDPAVMRLLSGELNMHDINLLEVDKDKYHVRLGNDKQDVVAPKLWLQLDNNAAIIAIESLDALGNKNRIELHHIAKNIPPAERFSFSPPDGVDIITLE